jgi:enoyl-CoA hydratase/carnithine racemase
MPFQVPHATGFLHVAMEDGVARVVIDRPARKNALTQAMWRELSALCGALSADADVRVIVFAGSGADFCAGADISEFDEARADDPSARAYESDNSAAFAAVRTCPVPTIAAIRGTCYGGGFGIAAACDLRIAADDARFAVPAARLGLAYPVDAMPDIVAAVGPQMAKYLTFSGGRLDAAAALSAGFLLEVVPEDALALRVEELAATIAANAPLSVRASKASIRAALTGDPADALAAAHLGDRTFASADYAEGRAAFREKRPALFTGT